MSKNKKARRITIVAALPAPRRRQRLTKMIPFYQEAGFSVRFRGWDRVRGEASEWRWDREPIDEAIILTGGGHNSSVARAMYPVWIVRVFLFAMFSPRRSLFHCLGWETAFPTILAGLFRSHQVVFDDADRFSMVLGVGGLVGRMLFALEDWTAARSILHIIPSFSRYNKTVDSDFLLPNTPTRADIEAARALRPEKPAAFVVYANGWLPQTRGALIILEAFRRFSVGKSDVQLLVAGFIPDQLLSEFSGLEALTYIGEVPQVEALALYQVSDVLVTLYDPNIEINRRAESNKWGDACCFGVPFIVNFEVETARKYIESGAAFSVPYGDIDELASLFEELYSKRDMLSDASARLARMRDDFQLFDERMKEAVQKIAVVAEAK